MAELERCAMCREPALKCSDYGACSGVLCNATGPADDPTGTKWNEMQRLIRAGRALEKLERMVSSASETARILDSDQMLLDLSRDATGAFCISMPGDDYFKGATLLDAIEAAEEGE